MKRALVTGGSGAIGCAISRELALAGHHVIVHANENIDRAELLAGELRARGASAQSVVFDVTDADASGRAIESLSVDGPVQLLVNNAGIHDDAPFAGMRREQWQRVLAVSLDGFYNVTRPVLMPMMRTRWGRIVNLSSVAGLFGTRGQTNYAAAKAGLIGATRSLSREVASRGITVNAVAPGIIVSPMTEASFPAERIKELVPMKRAGTPEEVASLVAYLCSDRAGYISGQCITIDGGMI